MLKAKEAKVKEAPLEWNLPEPPADFRPPARDRLVSYSLPSPGLSANSFLRQAQGQERFFWQDGRSGLTIAAFGVATELIAWGERRFEIMRTKVADLFRDAHWLNSTATIAGPRLFGGFAFNDDFAPDNTWSVFHPAHFILPHYQFVQQGDESWLTLNALLPPEEYSEDSFLALRQAVEARYHSLLAAAARQTAPDTPRPQVVQVNYPMPYVTWEAKINEAIDQFKTTELKKVVLSRICELRFEEPVDVDGALEHLNRQYANCYRFLFEPRPYHSFYGATPELLAEVEGRTLTTMGLASSIRRGQSEAEDKALASQLLNDPKERYEHSLVIQAIRKRLETISDQLQIADEPAIYKLSNIQHLYTPVYGRLHQKLGILPIVELLHPTPALGGSPRNLAMAFIRQAEPAPRGWYAAPIGWIDHNLNGTFAVAIRSAVSQDRRVWLYAGAGIVADSVPQKEWDETALKFKPLLDALGVAGVPNFTANEATI